jgi:hypothetical protein
MPSHLYKMLALSGDNNTYGDGEGTHGQSTRQAVINSNTAWVKFAFYWRSAQPQSRGDIFSTWAHMNDVANSDPNSHLAQLDRQIRWVNTEASRIGRTIAVVLTMYNDYPEWLPKPEDSQGWPVRGLPRKRIPHDVGVSSAWGWVLGYLYYRYALYGVFSSGPSSGPPYFGNPQGAFANVIEFANEPNQHPDSQGCWPQKDPGGCSYMPGQVAQMAKTADAYAAYLLQQGRANGSLGPAVADIDPSSDDYKTHFVEFTNSVLDSLGGWTPSAYQGWSLHNYRDVATQQVSRFQNAAGLLNAKGPYRNAPIWISEGGYNVAGFPESQQSSRLNTNYFNLNNQAQAYNQCQWRMVDTPGEAFATGLRVYGEDPNNPYLRDRPAFAQWSQMPATIF